MWRGPRSFILQCTALSSECTLKNNSSKFRSWFWTNVFRCPSYLRLLDSWTFQLYAQITSSFRLTDCFLPTQDVSRLSGWSRIVPSSSLLSEFWNEDAYTWMNLDHSFFSLVFTHTLKWEVRWRKVSSLQGIVIPPMGWSYPNSSSAWLSKSRNKGSFKYDTGITNRFFWLSPTYTAK